MSGSSCWLGALMFFLISRVWFCVEYRDTPCCCRTKRTSYRGDDTIYSFTGFGSALNIDTLHAILSCSNHIRFSSQLYFVLSDIYIFLFDFQPSSEVQDKISFLMNNIGSTNVDAKAKEFSEILKEECYPWFAQYMVMKRLRICICPFFLMFS